MIAECSHSMRRIFNESPQSPDEKTCHEMPFYRHSVRFALRSSWKSSQLTFDTGQNEQILRVGAPVVRVKVQHFFSFEYLNVLV